MAVPAAPKATVTSAYVAMESVAVRVDAPPSSATVDALADSVTVGALSASVIVIVWD